MARFSLLVACLTLLLSHASAQTLALRFVRALDFDPLTGYKESHEAACTRVGLLATSSADAPLSADPTSPVYWSVDTMGLVVNTLGNSSVASPAMQGCCSPGMWCRRNTTMTTTTTATSNSSSLYSCSTNALGGNVFTNYGWTADNSSTPVYSCTDPGIGLASFASGLPRIGVAKAVNVSASFGPTISRLRMDGVNFGKSGAALSVTVGGAVCSDVDVCQTTCTPCYTTSDCGSSNMLCLLPSGSPTGVCLRVCNSDGRCPCDGECYEIPLSLSYSLYMCADPNLPPVNANVCGNNFKWGPDLATTNMTDRIECTPSTVSGALSGTAAAASRVGGRFLSRTAEGAGDVDEASNSGADSNEDRGSGSEKKEDLPPMMQAPVLLEGRLKPFPHDADSKAIETMRVPRTRRSLSSSSGRDVVGAAALALRRARRAARMFEGDVAAEAGAAKLKAEEDKYGKMSASAFSASYLSSSSSSAASPYTSRSRSLQATPSTSPSVASGVDSGWDRYDVACAAGGAAGAGYPGTYPVIVRKGPFTSTGIGAAEAAAAGVELPLFNVSGDGGRSGNRSGSVFGDLPYSGWVPSYQQKQYACVGDVDCPLIDECTIPRCNLVTTTPFVRGCCSYHPSGRCTTADSPLVPGDYPTHNAYFALPSQVSAVLPLPPPPRGGLDATIVDPTNRNPSYNPHAILWDEEAIWYNLSTPGAMATFTTAYTLNPSSTYDDSPLSSVALSGWTFPFFGQSVSTLWVGANGFLRIVSTDPCEGSFIHTGCSFSNDYAGLIAPLVTDYNPGAYAASEIWTADFNALQLSTSAGRPGPAPASARVFCIVFADMGLFRQVPPPANLPPDPSFTFSLCLYGDGGVRWRYGRILGLPSPPAGSWNATTEIPIGGGGPPNTTIWLSGVRSLSAATGTKAETALLAGYNTLFNVDVAVKSPNELLLSRGAVRPAGTAALCSISPVACLDTSCGAAGTRVLIRWSGLGCGLGFEALLPRWTGGVGVGTPRLQCVFGSVPVPATWISVPASGSAYPTFVVECFAPVVPEIADILVSSPVGTAAVPLLLQVILPISTSAFTSPNGTAYTSINSGRGVSSGIGPSAPVVNVSQGEAVFPLEVYGVVAISYGSGSGGGGGGTNGSSSSTSTVLMPRTLQFLYAANANASCGCDSLSASFTCDSCSVCGGNGTSRDCAGVCFGTAFTDSCGACSGGTTSHVPNSDQDCNGVCFGPNRDCVRASPKPQAVVNDNTLLLMTVIIIALFTCLFALFSVMAYMSWAACMRQRARDAAVDNFMLNDPGALGIPPGLSQSQLDRIPVSSFDPENQAFKDTVPGGGESCPVCMEDFKKDEHLRRLPPCGHAFHLLCVDTWLTRSTVCPVCRAELRTPDEINALSELRRQRQVALRAALGMQMAQPPGTPVGAGGGADGGGAAQGLGGAAGAAGEGEAGGAAGAAGAPPGVAARRAPPPSRFRGRGPLTSSAASPASAGGASGGLFRTGFAPLAQGGGGNAGDAAASSAAGNNRVEIEMSSRSNAWAWENPSNQGSGSATTAVVTGDGAEFGNSNGGSRSGSPPHSGNRSFIGAPSAAALSTSARSSRSGITPPPVPRLVQTLRPAPPLTSRPPAVLAWDESNAAGGGSAGGGGGAPSPDAVAATVADSGTAAAATNSNGDSAWR